MKILLRVILALLTLGMSEVVLLNRVLIKYFKILIDRLENTEE